MEDQTIVDTGRGSPQFATGMLEMIIPGFSVFSSALYAYAGIDLNMYIPFILLVSWFLWSGSYISTSVRDFVERHFMCSVRIRTDDEIFNMVMAWASRQDFSQKSRSFMANTNINSRSWTMLWFTGGDEDEDDDEGGDGYFGRRNGKKNKNELKYTPSYGSHRFWYKGMLLFFDRLENRELNSAYLASEKEEIIISCLWWNPRVLKDLLIDVREQYMDKDENRTVIYRGTFSVQEGTSWTRCMARSSRPFSTVILNEKVKQELITDVTDYLNPATRRWYANRGIPYRRGYLLHGPPGTGKSSLSLALAGFFKLRIYILTLSSSSATEENVSQLFSSLPRKCVVLLEDIDTAGLTHTREATSSATDASQPTAEPTPTVVPGAPPAPATPSGKLSLSGLLNILDGVASQEGRVLIMTTNHIEKLDRALIRPGRVDLTVKFGHADADMAVSIFRAIYAPYEGEELPSYSVDGGEESGEKAADSKAATLEKVQHLAQQFAAKIPENEFSPAEIQGLLLKHKREPLAAIEAADEWVVTTRKEKEEKKLREAEETLKKEKEEEEKKKKEEEEKKKKEKEEEEEKKKKDEKEEENKNKTEEKKNDKETNDAVTDETKAEKGEEEKAAKVEHDDKSTDTSEAAPESSTNDGKATGSKEPSDSGYETP